MYCMDKEGPLTLFDFSDYMIVRDTRAARGGDPGYRREEAREGGGTRGGRGERAAK